LNASAILRADDAAERAASGNSSPRTRADVPARLKFAVHGPVVEVENFLPGLGPHLDRLLGAFSVPSWPDGFLPVHGTVRAYDQADVLRHLSPGARPLPRVHDLTDVFEDGERFWVVDERWGMAEINFLKGHWRSWVLPRPQFDALRCAEMAVLWPLAQLLRPRGVHLLPAAAAARDGFAFLLVCPFGVEGELNELADAGYKLIGRRWTAVREEDGRAALLHMPAATGRTIARAMGGTIEESDSADGSRSDPWQNHAFCDAVLIADAVRRPRASLKELPVTAAAGRLRSAWPIAELHPSRRHSPLPGRLAHLCRCAELQLSRDPADLLSLLDSLRHMPTAALAA